MISKEQVILAREMILKSISPVFLFDDDPDGLCSFLLLYRMYDKGHGIVIKNQPKLTEEVYVTKAKRYSPDLIVILDKPMVEDSFLESFSCPIVWIDHHSLQSPPKKVLYINPLQNGEASPTTRQCWEIAKEENPLDIWIALLGIIGDWYFPKELVEISEKIYPGLVLKDCKTAQDALFMKGSRIGILVKMLYFNLKGKITDVERCFKIMTRVKDPYEIIDGSTSQGKYLMKNFEKINIEYEKLKEEALSRVSESKFLIAILPQKNYSFSSELSNEVFYNHPEKIVILGRSSSGYTKGSIRTSFDLDMHSIIRRCIVGLDGYGGGHPQACGFKIKDEDFEIFLEKFKSDILDNLKD